MRAAAWILGIATVFLVLAAIWTDYHWQFALTAVVSLGVTAWLGGTADQRDGR